MWTRGRSNTGSCVYYIVSWSRCRVNGAWIRALISILACAITSDPISQLWEQKHWLSHLVRCMQSDWKHATFPLRTQLRDLNLFDPEHVDGHMSNASDAKAVVLFRGAAVTVLVKLVFVLFVLIPQLQILFGPLLLPSLLRVLSYWHHFFTIWISPY